MRRDIAWLASLVIGTAAAMAVLLSLGAGTDVSPALAALRIVAAVLLALVLPGYALAAAIFPPGALCSRRYGQWLPRGMWACGLSLAASVLGGLVLNLMPAGLTRTTWTVFLGVLTLLAIATATMRTGRPAARPVQSFRMPRPRASALAALGCVLSAVVLGVAAIRVAQVSAERQHTTGFAQLWLVPAQNSAATIGVRSDYPGERHFRLVLRRGARVVASWNLGLASGQTWRSTVPAPANTGLRAELSVAGLRAAPEAVQITPTGGGL